MAEVTVYATNSIKQWMANKETWAECHDAPESDHKDSANLVLGSSYGGGFLHYLFRSFLYFDLSEDVPEGAGILSVKLYLKVSYKYSTTGNFDCIIQKSADGSRPSDPPVNSDYNYVHYSGNYGSKNISAMTVGEYVEIEIIDLSLIETITKFIMRTERDIDDSIPGGTYTEDIEFYSHGAAEGNRPYLVVEYEARAVTTNAATDIDLWSVTGNGEITSGTNATERGFIVTYSFSGSLKSYMEYRRYGWEGDVNLVGTNWEGTLTLTVNESGDFEEGAYALVIGLDGAVIGQSLFPGTTYLYKAYAVIDEETYYGEDVEFTTNSLPSWGGNEPGPEDAVSPTPDVPEPTLPEDDTYEPIDEEDPDWPEWPELEPLPPAPTFPPEDIPELVDPQYDPDWTFPSYFGMKLDEVDEKKDWIELRKKCRAYQENMTYRTLIFNHNFKVFNVFLRDYVSYVDSSAYEPLPKHLKFTQFLEPLNHEPLESEDFKKMINSFREAEIMNDLITKQNFVKMISAISYIDSSAQLDVSDYTYGVDSIKESKPMAKRMIRKVDEMRIEAKKSVATFKKNVRAILEWL